MATEILSLAYVRPDEGKEEQTLQVLSELYVLMRRKGYSRDRLYRDAREPGRFLNLRYWTSEEARQQAQEDPDVHRMWQRLAEISRVEGVVERLEEITGQWMAGVG